MGVNRQELTSLTNLQHPEYVVYGCLDPTQSDRDIRRNRMNIEGMLPRAKRLAAISLRYEAGRLYA